MLNNAQTERMLVKLKRLESTLEPYLFTKLGEMDAKRFETMKQFHQIPSDDGRYIITREGDTWGQEGSYCWFRGTVRIPEAWSGQDIYLNPNVGGYEAMLWVNGVPAGVFANKILEKSHGNHYSDLLVQDAVAGGSVEVAIEFYAGHYIIGTSPFDVSDQTNFNYTFQDISLCKKNLDIAGFLFDLRTLNQMAEKLDPLSFRRADIINCLTELHRTVFYDIEAVEESIWRPALAKGREVMKPVLEAKNADSAAMAGIVGHSHMDTAWLWPISETVKKCARTYSNQISLMKQYPEYQFVQSSSYHTEVIRRNYPALFEQIREKVTEGRYEPNGAVWVESDCNITSGESLVRQFLWGQRYTDKHFGYRSNCFWLPDTFGYSAAIPQIMKSCGVDYFLTNKMSWNDTNRFPYETFYWEGIDGTTVLTHFNTIHCWPDAKTILERLEGRGSEDNAIKNKTVSRRRLIAYGYGDGGGGPQFEMLEMARRIRDLDGCPKTEHISVGEFMQKLDQEITDAPHYRGELYLELHRGTLTNQHQIKRNNRKAEIALHDLEFLNVQDAVRRGAVADDQRIRPILETILVNQFHDILPGTCIEMVHVLAVKEMNEVLEQLQGVTDEVIGAGAGTGTDAAAAAGLHEVTVFNTLGFPRSEIIYLDTVGGIPATDLVPKNIGLTHQIVQDMHGAEKLCIANISLPSLGSTVITLQDRSMAGQVANFDSDINYNIEKVAPFHYLQSDSHGNEVLTTPFARVTFAANGTIDSFIDTRVDRELRGKGLPLNTLIMAEDVPVSYDNWDFDADSQLKFKPVSKLAERSVISNGEVQFRIRSRYQISERSSVLQDMIFYSWTPRVDFETVIAWKDKHRFLKTDFDTTVLSNTARHEIQFGHSQKPTTRNTTIEQAMFEVLNHKYTDLSETRYGVAILNDSKYGVTAEGSAIRLSLHKGGTRPDPRGDEGIHECTYSFLPHVGDFSADTVVLPAYALNYRPIVKNGADLRVPFAAIDQSNIILETVKACEDNDRAFILRLYEAEGTFTHANLTLGMKVQEAQLTNMLEEPVSVLAQDEEWKTFEEVGRFKLSFKPFEIKTVRVSY